MHLITSFFSSSIIALFLVAAWSPASMGAGLSQFFAADAQVPFGDQISTKIFNYHRHTPSIATSGKLASGAMDELKSQGFKTIIDLRMPREGTQAEAVDAKAAGITYFNIPVGRSWPSANTFETFKNIVENPDNHPLLVHCGSANRVGMVWANYQISKGASIEQAILEGKTIGMKPSLEKLLRKNLPDTDSPEP